jgi:Helicase conserved C-terminal domain
VPGAPARALAELLDAAGDRESHGGAVTWRFNPGSVRRALDAGYPADDLLAALRARAVGGALPQPLSYLVGDVARRHGAVRVRAVACVLRVADPALVAEIAGARALRSLRLTTIAPTVLGSAATAPQTLAALRAAGYAPVAESADGAVEVERAKPRRAVRPRPARGPGRQRGQAAEPEPVDPKLLAERLLAAPMPKPRRRLPEPVQEELFGTPELSDDAFESASQPALDVDTVLAEVAGHLAPGERRLLAHALATGEPVTIGYTNSAGNHTIRVIDSAELDGAHLIAWCQLRDDERMFSLHRIDSIAPA